MRAAPEFKLPARPRRSKSRAELSSIARAPWQRCVAGGIGTAGVIGFAAWKVPMGLPGHRALGWLTVLILVRLIAGPGSATVVGVLGAAAVLALGISPDGIYGVADYAIAGFLIDATLAVRPAIARNGVKLAVLGAIVLLAVGWIAPVGQSLTGGIPMADVWPSLVSAFGAGLSRLVALDLAFGAAAGVMGWGLATALHWAGTPGLAHVRARVASTT